jgi:hypothetical protein
MARTKCGFDDLPGAVPGQQLLTFHGPTLGVTISFDPEFVFTGNNPPPAQGLPVRALVDTGATVSCIDNIVAAQLNLPIIDRQPIAGVGGQHLANMYMAQIFVPNLNFWIYGTFAGVDLAAGGQMHRALIGRTFLRNFTMEYHGRTGTVIIHND